MPVLRHPAHRNCTSRVAAAAPGCCVRVPDV